MRVEQFSGDMRVIASGTVIAYDPSDELRVVLHFDDDIEDFEIRWRFVECEDSFKSTLDGPLYVDGGIIFTCTNFFIKKREVGNYHPIYIGSIEDKEYYIWFFVSGIGDVTRKLEYCLYEVEKAAEQDKAQTSKVL